MIDPPVRVRGRPDLVIDSLDKVTAFIRPYDAKPGTGQQGVDPNRTDTGTASVVYSSDIPACAGRPGLGKGQIFWVARYGELLF
jgi:hypothetical protein